MAVLQMAMGYFKLGALSDFFPHSAVHGMLAAIGLIIISKQIPVLLGDDPALYKGEGPIDLFVHIPRFIANAHWHIAIVGFTALAVMISIPKLRLSLLKQIPTPMFVLILTVPLAMFWHFNTTEPAWALVQIGDFWGNLGLNVDFSAIGTFTFWKYVFMFLFVSSLESLLTVKAIDQMDPLKRESDYNGDLKGQGAGNLISGLLGGIPMISEVVRSSANVNFGARSKWSNFFHGAFLLTAMLVLIPLIEMIPNAALAAMLIYAGFRLAAPKEFVHTYHIGKEQLIIFNVTIFVTLFEDLLLGVAAGILVKIFFHWYNGASLSSLFKADFAVTEENGKKRISVKGAAVFSNLLLFKKAFKTLDKSDVVVFDVTGVHLIDHSFLSYLNHFQREHQARGGVFEIEGLDHLYPLSDHPLATRVARTR
jgi:MFS superfamily sulfate permease-like transporter